MEQVLLGSSQCAADDIACAVRELSQSLNQNPWLDAVPTLVATLVGAFVGALAAWLFALDLRRRDKEDREVERTQAKLDRAAEREEEREQDRLDRERERIRAMRARRAETERAEEAESARRWLAVSAALVSHTAVPDWERHKYLAESLARISDAYVLSLPDEQEVGEALKNFGPDDIVIPRIAGRVSGQLLSLARGEYPAEHVAEQLRSILAESRRLQAEKNANE